MSRKATGLGLFHDWMTGLGSEKNEGAKGPSTIDAVESGRGDRGGFLDLEGVGFAERMKRFAWVLGPIILVMGLSMGDWMLILLGLVLMLGLTWRWWAPLAFKTGARAVQGRQSSRSGAGGAKGIAGAGMSGSGATGGFGGTVGAGLQHAYQHMQSTKMAQELQTRFDGFGWADWCRVSSVRSTPDGGSVIEVRYTLMEQLRKLEEALPTLARIYGAPVAFVKGIGHNRAEISLLKTDPLGGTVYYQKDLKSSLRSVPLGLNESGEEVRVPVLESNILLAGLPGSGKSVGLNAIVAGLAQLPQVALFGIDLKRVELSLWANRFTRTALDGDAATALLEDLNALMEVRYRQLVSEGKRKYDENDFTPEIPLVVLVVDEMAQLVAGSTDAAGKKEDAARVTLLQKIIQLGRAAGFVVIGATQRPSSEVIPTRLRDLFQIRIAYRTTTPEMTTMIVGATTEPVPAHHITQGQKGVCFVTLESEIVPVKARTYLLPDAGVTYFAQLMPRSVAERWTGLLRSS